MTAHNHEGSVATAAKEAPGGLPNGAPRSSEPAPPLGPPGSPPLPIWALHRRLYDWVLKFAHHKHSTTALFLIAFAESSFFPVPPDVLQIAMTLERRSRAWWYAAVSSVGSLLGGVAGYLIGMLAWAAVKGFFFKYVFDEAVFERVQGLYQQWDFWAIFVAAFTPIPYKVFTIAAGVFEIALPMFIIGSCVGRAGRFFIVAALLYRFGPPMKRFIERYFNLLSLVFAALLIGAFVLLKLL